MMVDDRVRAFLARLHIGGAWGYWWYTSEAKNDKQQALEKTTIWWPNGKPVSLPKDYGRYGARHIYFGIHPTSIIPQERTTPDGSIYRPRPAKCRPVVEEIAVINCLFAEFDAKRFAYGKMGALEHIDNLDIPPSIVIDSGGGYHTYTLLDEPFVLVDDDARDYARRLQYAWVSLVDSDEDAKDLSRVLRVPGTYNYKENYGPNFPQVRWVRCDLDRQYAISDLENTTRPFLTHGRESKWKNEDTRRDSLSEYERVEEALARISADRWGSYQGWIDIGMALHSWDNGYNGLSLWDRYSRGKAPSKWEAGICEAKWATFQPKDITVASIFHWADQDTPRISINTMRRNGTRPDTLPAQTVQDKDDSAQSDPPAEQIPILLRATELYRIPPAQELIPNLLYVNTLHQIFGAPGGGKSFLALDIAATAAQHYNVVYIAAEAIEDYEIRLDAWQAHHHRSVPNLYFWRQPLTLASEQDVRGFIAAVQTIQPALIVMDPLADCMTGLDESTAKDMSVVVFALNTIRRATKAAILVIHHTGWNVDHERGHSILRGASRVVAKVEAREDGLIRLVCEKKNHGRKFDPRSFRLVSAGEKGGALILPSRLVVPGKVRMTDKLLRVMEAMTTEPLRRGATHTDLQKDTAITAGTLNRILTGLTDIGYIRADENGRSRKYILTPLGNDALDMAFEERSDSWNAGGRTLEESGNEPNWNIASSTILPHTDGVLPNSSNSLPHTGIYISPPTGDIYIPCGQDEKVLPRGEKPEENAVKQYQPLAGYDGDAAEPDGDTEPVVVPNAPEPTTPQSTFDTDFVKKMLAAGNIAAVSMHYRLRRKDDIRGLDNDAIIELAEREVGGDADE